MQSGYEYALEYEPEELIPIVGKLADKYTSRESSSVSWETAGQLMEAVLYCIREAGSAPGPQTGVMVQRPSALQSYETGYRCVKEKTERALDVYNELAPVFESYENRCLYDTFVRGMPEFFRRYDLRFRPQDTILTLDYPVLRDLSGFSGIDRIYEYILCVRMEQLFLKSFPKDCVLRVLARYSRGYRSMVENLTEIVLLSAVGHMLAGKRLWEEPEEEDYLRMEQYLAVNPMPVVRERVRGVLGVLVREGLGTCEGMEEYLGGAADGILVRLQNAAGNHVLRRLC